MQPCTQFHKFATGLTKVTTGHEEQTSSGRILVFFLFVCLFFIFPLYSKGVRLSLHVYITITVFPPPFLLLQHEYLDIVLNAIQRDLLVNLF